LSFEEELVFLPNKIYGIIGQNRSGKSTLVNLITKLYVPQRGTLTWNGIQYASIQRKSLRNVIAYVAQKPFIFPGTIADNIRMGNTEATEDDIINAAEKAGIFLYDEFKQQQLKAQAAMKEATKKTTMKRIKSRALEESKYNSANSDGEEIKEEIEYDEPIGAEEQETNDQEIAEKIEPLEEKEPEPEPEPLTEEEKQEKKKKSAERKRRRQVRILNGKTLARGSNLSGGFAQSVALARIFLKKDAKIVILDESMSAMDPIKKRQVIFPNLLSFAKERNLSLIMITHDMNNLELFDHVLMLENGRIVCQGKHEELMDSRNFKYLQMLGINLSSL
jgi:ABC-type multidrug transport system fused ATPase/permease subunit